MYKGGYATLRYLIAFTVTSTLLMFFHSFYSLLIIDSINLLTICFILIGLIFSYFILFANVSITQRRQIANSTYVFILVVTSVAILISSYNLASVFHEINFFADVLEQLDSKVTMFFSILTLIVLLILLTLIIRKLFEKKVS